MSALVRQLLRSEEDTLCIDAQRQVEDSSSIQDIAVSPLVAHRRFLQTASVDWRPSKAKKW